MLAGVIFGTLAIAWIAYLVPEFLARRGQVDQLDQAAIDQFAESMQVVRRSGDSPSGFLTDSGAEVSTPHTRRAARHDLRQLSRISTKRRRVGLLVHLGLVIAGVVLPFVLPISHWWTALPVGLLVGWLVVSRISVVSVGRLLAEARAEIDFGDEEDTIVIAEAPVVETAASSAAETERSIEITGPIGETLGSLWDPIPVTPTTYVSRPLLPRSVRTIDLSAPVAASELGVPVTAEKPSLDQPELPGLRQLPRAVGE